MIARNVHKSVPKDQLEREMFKKYFIAKKRVKSKVKVINIDDMPVLV